MRDSDVKRKILDADRTFDEGALGFPKFSKFLEQASEDGVITLRREGRVTEVSLPAEGSASTPTAPADPVSSDATESPSGDDGADDHGGPADGKATVIEVEPPKRGLFGLRLGPRRGATRRRGGDGASLFGFGGTSADSASEGESDDDSSASIGTGVAAQELAALEAAAAEQAEAELEDLRIDEESVDYGDGDHDADEAPEEGSSSPSDAGDGDVEVPDVPLDQLGLPSDPGAIARYLTHRYKGVGEKTAETLVERLGSDLFRALHERPDEIATIIPPKRAEQVLEAWRNDYQRRATSASERSSNGSGGRRGGRGRSRGRGRD